jgi:hypothetical protein
LPGIGPPTCDCCVGDGWGPGSHLAIQIDTSPA